MSGNRVTETVQFYVIITYTFVSELGKIMMYMIFTYVKLYINAQQPCDSIAEIYFMPDVSEFPQNEL